MKKVIIYSTVGGMSDVIYLLLGSLESITELCGPDVR
jgi:hypothetical protein